LAFRTIFLEVINLLTINLDENDCVMRNQNRNPVGASGSVT
jgi:hypothetical protein